MDAEIRPPVSRGSPPRDAGVLAAFRGGVAIWVSLGVLLAVVVGFGGWLLFLRTPPDGAAVTQYATRSAPIETAPDSAAASAVGDVARGDSLTGAWVLGADGKTRWLKVRQGTSTGFVSADDLSDRARPTLATGAAGARPVQSSGVVYPEPDASTTVVDSVSPGDVLTVNGQTADGWSEVTLKSGAIGYVRPAVFEAPSAPPAPQITPQSDAPSTQRGADGAPVAVSAGPAAQGTFTYACAYAPEQSVNAPDSLPGMSFTIDEARACVNSRTAYRRDARGALSRMMLIDAERRASLLYFTPDRRMFFRQDIMLPPDAYAQIRQTAAGLARLQCPDDAAGAGQVADTLARSTPNLSPQALPPGSGWKRLAWRCAPVS
jgi:hypothetical protein